MAEKGSPEAQREELAQLRDAVRCEVVLEKEGFRLDREATAQRSARNLKYRRGSGEIIIVNHEGKGWWDPTDSTSRGDVFKLMQHLHPDLNLGHVRRELRQMVGLEPSYEVRTRTAPVENDARPHRDPAWMWANRNPPRQSSPAWSYLNTERGLPDTILKAAIAQNLLREGPQGTAWFAHRDNEGAFSGMEMRGPSYRGFSTGGIGKRLFRFEANPGAEVHRVVLTESAIDALSFAAMDRFSRNSLYLSTAGGMSPESVGALKTLLAQVATRPEGRLIIAVDNDRQGDAYAARFKGLAEEAGLWNGRLSPKTPGEDWNTVLRTHGGKNVSPPRPLAGGAESNPPRQEADWIDGLRERRRAQATADRPTPTRPDASRASAASTPGV